MGGHYPAEPRSMKVLLTNDDGIEADGLQALRRALLSSPSVELAVIAPDGNRSAMARSITTRRPLWVEEVDFGDGTVGYATDGTPVDCVRFAKLGLIDGFEAEVIVAGINHGANLGDDITYSGTVAAALEGIVLGLPAIAVSPAVRRARARLPPRPQFDFTVAARFAARIVDELDDVPLPRGRCSTSTSPPATRTASRSRAWASASTATSSSSTRRTRRPARATGSTATTPASTTSGHRPRRRRRRPHRGDAAALRPHRHRRDGRARAARPLAAAAPAAEEVE